MKKWQITSTTSEQDLGIYEGETPEDALDAMAQDAGYRDHADACERVGGGEDLDVSPAQVTIADCSWEDLCEWEACQSPRRQAPVILDVDPAERTAELRTWAEIYGMPASVYHGRRLHLEVGTVDAESILEYLRDGEGQELLQRICDGYEERWDGNDHRGHYTERAQDARHELEAALRDTDSERIGGMWEAHNWLYGASPVDLGVSATSTDEELAAAAKEVVENARHDYRAIVEEDEVLECLQEMREELQEDDA